MADNNAPLSPQAMAQIDELLGLSTQRLQRTEPLHEAAMAMATRMAPGYARGAMNGGGGPSASRPSGPASSSLSPRDKGGFGMDDAAQAALMALLSGGGAAGGGNLAKLFALIKKLFGGNKGDQPPVFDPNYGRPSDVALEGPVAGLDVFNDLSQREMGWPDQPLARSPIASVTTDVQWPSWMGGDKPRGAGRWPDEDFWERNG